jgi:PAS domain S-box-containing protein
MKKLFIKIAENKLMVLAYVLLFILAFAFYSQLKITALIGLTMLLLTILVVMVVKNVKNIDQQKNKLVKKEKELFLSEHLYKELFNKSPMPKWVCDRRTLHFYEVNDAAVKHYGYTREEFLNLTVFDLRPEEDHKKMSRYLQSDVDSSSNEGLRKHIKKNGEIIWVEILLDDTIYHGKEAVLVVINDVTEKLRAEETIRRSEEFYRTILENSSDIQLISDSKGITTYTSSSILRNFGFSKEELTGKTRNDFWHPDDMERNQQKILDLATKPGSSISVEVRCLDKENKYRWCEARISNELHNPVIHGYVSNYSDINERKLAEQKLVESEELYRSLFNKSPLPIFVADKEGLQYLEVNDTAIELYGYSREEFLKLTVFDVRSESDHLYLQGIVDQGTLPLTENNGVHHIKKNGEIMTVDVALDTINYKGKEAYLVIVNDITKTLQLQQQLTDEKLNKQIEITRATISGQENERNELGKELHDNVNQILATAKLYLVSSRTTKDKQEEYVEIAKNLVDDSINEIRKISKSLIPPSLGDLSLKDALKELIPAIKLTNKNIHLKTEGLKEEALCDDLKISVYRIVQEQLNNIMKYAEASDILIKVTQSERELALLVADNGKGFDVTQKRNGIGITNIINRATTFDGKVVIDSSSGHGCRLNVNFKLLAAPGKNLQFSFNGFDHNNHETNILSKN